VGGERGGGRDEEEDAVTSWQGWSLDKMWGEESSEAKKVDVVSSSSSKVDVVSSSSASSSSSFPVFQHQPITRQMRDGDDQGGGGGGGGGGGEEKFSNAQGLAALEMTQEQLHVSSSSYDMHVSSSSYEMTQEQLHNANARAASEEGHWSKAWDPESGPMHTHTRTHAHTHTLTHARAHTHTHPQTHTRIHVHKYTKTHKHTYSPN
jgi:hypothetical protein